MPAGLACILNFYVAETDVSRRIGVDLLRFASNIRPLNRRFPADRPRVGADTVDSHRSGTSDSNSRPLARWSARRKAAACTTLEFPIKSPQTPTHHFSSFVVPANMLSKLGELLSNVIKFRGNFRF